MKKILAGLMMLFVAAGCAAQADADRRADQPEISGVVLDVHREDEAGEVCEDIIIMATGEVEITACDGTVLTQSGSTLTDAQLATLLDWARIYGGSTLLRSENVQMNELTSELVFNGRGAALPPSDFDEDLLAFIDEVYAQHADLNAGM